MPRKSKEKKKPRGNFTDRPEDGWLHDGRGLAAGQGVYFSFPVYFLGSIELPTTLRNYADLDSKAIIMEAMAKTAETTEPGYFGKGKKRKLEKVVKKYEYADITEARVHIKFSVSATGILLSTPDDIQDEAQKGVIGFHPMTAVFGACGGDDQVFYDLIGFVARDKTSNKRECFVFDAGEFAGDLLSTLGQAFVLANELLRKQQLNGMGPKPVENPLYDKIVEPLRMPAGAEEQIYGVASNIDLDPPPLLPRDSAEAGAIARQPLYDEVPPYLDPLPDAQNPAYYSLTSVLKQMGQQELYALPDENTYEKLVDALNRSDVYLSKKAEDCIAKQRQRDTEEGKTYALLHQTRPKWEVYQAEEVVNNVPIANLKFVQESAYSALGDM
eukprot:m.146459 g.146459  ORF g.146459 m.146459 type:complete len:385 (-) comp14973_c0_seq1:163-1317(-)